MKADRLAKILAASIASHQSRGLVDDAGGMADVVIHGRADLMSVANDVLEAAARESRQARRSWAAWFIRGVEQRKDMETRQRHRQEIAAQLQAALTPADEALARLRLRALEV